MSRIDFRLRLAVKQILLPFTNQFPPIVLAPERLRLWMNLLVATRPIPGSIVEIGCAFAGTAAYSSKMLARLDDPREYVAYDTFSGFVPEQFDADAKVGTDRHQFGAFSANSLSYARKVAARHGGTSLTLVQGDICAPTTHLPDSISAALIDVDLEEPVYTSLLRVSERMTTGGVIIVDDCDGDGSDWKADNGYTRFVAERGLPDLRRNGIGFVGDSSLIEHLIHLPPCTA